MGVSVGVKGSGCTDYGFKDFGFEKATKAFEPFSRTL